MKAGGLVRHGRRDLNEPELVALALRLGCQWIEAPPLDGWLLWRGKWTPVEIKQPERAGRAREYTPAQQRFFDLCRANGGRWLVWRTTDDVVHALAGRVAA